MVLNCMRGFVIYVHGVRTSPYPAWWTMWVGWGWEPWIAVPSLGRISQPRRRDQRHPTSHKQSLAASRTIRRRAWGATRGLAGWNEQRSATRSMRPMEQLQYRKGRQSLWPRPEDLWIVFCRVQGSGALQGRDATPLDHRGLGDPHTREFWAFSDQFGLWIETELKF